MAQITRSDLGDLAVSARASVTDVKQLSSYNWIEADEPTIVVPGSPPLWAPPRASRQLEKDSGLFFIDQNAARHPECPLEPLFRSLYMTNPSFDIRSVDIITDRNNIRKLLSFIRYSASGNQPAGFTINIEVVQNTAILWRSEAAAREILGPKDLHGFGHEFEKTYTTSRLRGSTGHHRMVSYCFCGLKFIVRHQTDAYVKKTAITHAETSDLSQMMDILSLSPAQSAEQSNPAPSKLKVQSGGQTVPLDSTLEIKTRAIKNVPHFNDIAPQIWASQTPNLVLAYHYRGKFHTPEVEDVACQIKSWENANQSDLQKLGGLVKRITEIAKEYGGEAIVQYDVPGDRLLVTKYSGSKQLPADLYAKWTVGRDGKQIDLMGTKQSSDDGCPKPTNEGERKDEGKSFMSNSEDVRAAN